MTENVSNGSSLGVRKLSLLSSKLDIHELATSRNYNSN